MTSGQASLLALRELAVEVGQGRARRPILTDVTFEISPGRALGLVGESGSGKSMTARAIMRLLPEGARMRGQLDFDGRDLLVLPKQQLRSYRLRDVAMIYQDPRAHINPLRGVGDFLREGVRLTRGISGPEADKISAAALTDVGIKDAELRLRQYPHQLSGGLLQRVMIASALIARPRLLLADEPTTALDVTTQAEVMTLIDNMRTSQGLSLLFITHDLDLAAAVTDELAVMYAGTIVELGPAAGMHERALHPYTVALMQARPSLDKVSRLVTIPGRPVAAYEVAQGCVFASRCSHVQDVCRTIRPRPAQVASHIVACHRAEEFSRERGQLLRKAVP
jgi:oligopeptide/dipeptide ABC transporter ATP-binding protein